MEEALRPRLPLLWQAPTQVRIGTDPRWAVVLDELSPAAARALAGLRPGASARAVRVALAAEAVPAAEANAILEELRSLQLLVAGAPPAGADAATWSLLGSRRRGGQVRIRGAGRLSAALACSLATAGVRLVLADAGVVTQQEVGWAGLGPEHLGRSMADALAATLRLPAATRSQLTVLIVHGAVDPRRHRELLAQGQPHLPVVLQEAAALIGPLVRPGTPCLRCVELHRGDLDPAWPAVGAQLATGHLFPPEATLAAAAAATTAAAVLAFLDGRSSTTDAATIELRLPDLLPRRTEWSMHPDCGCAGP